ncbi:MAG: nitrous oxide reductase family maturation protein NosD [Polyangiaceae bacterium]
MAHDENDLTRMLADPNGPADIWLDGLVYKGNFDIARRLTLHGTGKSILDGEGRGTVVRVRADGVVLDDLVVRGSGRRFTAEDAGVKVSAKGVRVSHLLVSDVLFGVEFLPCPACTLENTRVLGLEGATELRGDGIKLWESHDSVVRGCVVEHGRDLVVWYSQRALLDGNVVRHGRYGTHFMYSHDAVIQNSRLEDNVVGIFVMYSARLRAHHDVMAGARGPAGMGIGFKESDGVSVDDNWLVANTTGIYLDRTPRDVGHPVTFDHNVLALNDVAVRFLSSQEGLTFTGNDFHQNVETAVVEGGGDALGSKFSGNHFSDYEGYDLDDDGVGDVPFELRMIDGGLTDAHPQVRFFQGTAALNLFDAVARAVPVFASRSVLIDRAPSMRPQRPR